jgi:hypothetical protein
MTSPVAQTFCESCPNDGLYFHNPVLLPAGYSRREPPVAEMASNQSRPKRKSCVISGSFALGHCAIAAITRDNLVTVIEDASIPCFNTRLALATHAYSHAYDHYGQMVEYLRMNGIIPPAGR